MSVPCHSEFRCRLSNQVSFPPNVADVSSVSGALDSVSRAALMARRMARPDFDRRARRSSKRKRPGAGPGQFGGQRENQNQERRSAVQLPEHSPEAAVQVPVPSVPDMTPVPVALWLPRATVTGTAPLPSTLPETVKEALPA